jgi:hypothetical protein
VVVAVTALLLNFKLFGALERRIDAVERRMEALETRLDQRLQIIQADLKAFFKELAEHDRRISRLENR